MVDCHHIEQSEVLKDLEGVCVCVCMHVCLLATIDTLVRRELMFRSIATAVKHLSLAYKVR